MKKQIVPICFKQLAVLFLVFINVAKAQPEINFNPFSQKFTSDMLVLYPFGPKGAPYLVNIEIEKTIAGEFYLVSTIDFVDGAYVASPFSPKNFKGKFMANLKEHTSVSLGQDITSIPNLQPIPFGAEPVDWIRKKTTFKQRIIVEKDVDFETDGHLSFTIEPRCTSEMVPFILSYKKGIMKVMPGGC